MKVTALLRVCYRSVTALLRVCYASVTALLPLCYRSATALLPLCYRSVTASVAVCFLAFLGFLFGVLQRSSAAFFPASDFVSINFSYSCCSRIIRFETIILLQQYFYLLLWCSDSVCDHLNGHRLVVNRKVPTRLAVMHQQQQSEPQALGCKGEPIEFAPIPIAGKNLDVG